MPSTKTVAYTTIRRVNVLAINTYAQWRFVMSRDRDPRTVILGQGFANGDSGLHTYVYRQDHYAVFCKTAVAPSFMLPAASLKQFSHHETYLCLYPGPLGLCFSRCC
jgi:hypothetical protein